MIFIDSNVPMYLVGVEHPNRDRVESFLRSNPERSYVTSAEVYQEIIHRYVAIERREAIEDAFEVLDAFAERIYPIRDEDVRLAHEVSQRPHELSGRDCLHVAVMENREIERILSCDEGFDLSPSVTRLPSE